MVHISKVLLPWQQNNKLQPCWKLKIRNHGDNSKHTREANLQRSMEHLYYMYKQ